MKTTVIISNYNYGRYVGGAIESVLGNEGDYLHEIIVVDDGSSDESREILSREYGNNEKVKLVFKENGGQFSCFRRGIELATGDVICFLDPDDRYERQYFSRIAEVYEEKPHVDFVYVGYKDVGDRNQVVLNFQKDTEIGITSIMTALTGIHFWSLTSTISVRKYLAKRLLALPAHYDWEFVSRADTAIEVALTVTDAFRYFIAEPLMLRMVHDSNFTHSMGSVQAIERRYMQAFMRVRHFFVREYSVTTDNTKLLKQEFRSLPFKNEEIFRQYTIAVNRMKVSFFRKIKTRISIYKYFYRYKKSLQKA